MRQVVFVALCFLILSGCAAGNRHVYNDSLVSVHSVGDKYIAVAVHDERPYVSSGKKRQSFAGLQRGGFGNPFDIITESGEPLVHDMAESITASLAAAGFRATAVFSEPTEDVRRLEERLIEKRADRILLLRVLEWKADTATNTALIYDINTYVLNGDGTILGEKRINGRDNLGGNAWNPPKHAKAAVNDAFKSKMGSIINSQEIMPALK